MGKTTLLNHLRSDFTVEGEPAREVIDQQRKTDGNGLWDKDRDLFLNLHIDSDRIPRFFEEK